MTLTVPDIAKDVMPAVLGAAVGLAGLLLIFSGFLFAQAASFPKETPDAIINKYRNAGRLGLFPFLIALTVAGLSFVWMIYPGPCVYRVTIIAFGVLLATSAIYGSVMLIWYL